MSIDFVKSLNAFWLSVAIMVVFFVAEYFISLRLKKKVFEFSDSIANTICGVMERGIYILFAVIYYGSFEYVHNHFALMNIPKTIWSALILFVAVDFLWYLYHRSGHVINVLWAAHITHHQSEQYNLTLSFRVSSIQLLIRMFFWLLLPLIGFDPMQTTVIIGINAAYQFFIHTRLIGRLGFLEEIFVTPSHHRVHHGKNEKYIDRNYGGIFIIWDRIFGTFQREEEEVEYGITKALNSYNPFQAWFHYFIDLYHASKMEIGLKNKIKIWFAGPETLGPYYDSLEKKEFKPNVLSSSLKYYIGIQFAFLCFVCITMFKWYGTFLHNQEIYAIVLFTAYSGVSYAAVLENKTYSAILEIGRILFTTAIIYSLVEVFETSNYIDSTIFNYVAVLYPAVFLIWLYRLKNNLLNYQPEPSSIKS